MGLEQKVEHKLSEGVKKLGGKAYKFVSPGNAGVPDRLCLLPGGLVKFVELKAPGQKLRPLQKAVVHQINKLGQEVFVVDNADAVQMLLAKWKGEIDDLQAQTVPDGSC